MNLTNGVLTTETVVVPTDPEVLAPPKTTTKMRKTYTARYKRQVVERCSQLSSTERGAYLRREGLYSSMVTRWSREVAAEADNAQPAKDSSPASRRLEDRQLQRKLEQLQRKLEKAEAVISLQKKALSLLDLLEESP